MYHPKNWCNSLDSPLKTALPSTECRPKLATEVHLEETTEPDLSEAISTTQRRVPGIQLAVIGVFDPDDDPCKLYYMLAVASCTNNRRVQRILSGEQLDWVARAAHLRPGTACWMRSWSTLSELKDLGVPQVWLALLYFACLMVKLTILSASFNVRSDQRNATYSCCLVGGHPRATNLAAGTKIRSGPGPSGQMTIRLCGDGFRSSRLLPSRW